ncbi:MAG: thioesterase family protein [Chitinophagaceae bacterium]|nr:thioesterase family protein [Chitinophagaceae bacterium]
MSRIKISVPDNFKFSTKIPIRITDVNYGGHVGNDSILSLIHEARMQFLKEYGYSEMDFDGTSLIMSDAAIEFRNELFYGNEVEVFVGIDNVARVSFDIFYKLLRTSDEKLIAIAKTGMICYNYQTKKITAIPDEVNDQLNSNSK